MPEFLTEPLLSPRFRDALVLTYDAHARQSRKGSRISALGHLLAVASLVIDDGGSEDEVIAGLLHDAVEDAGGTEMLERIRREFGEEVARIVWALSDAHTLPKPPWQERKERHIANLRNADASVRRVYLADKVANLRELVRQLDTSGAEVWTLFNGGREGTVWYYRTVLETLRPGAHTPLIDEYERLCQIAEQYARDHAGT